MPLLNPTTEEPLPTPDNHTATEVGTRLSLTQSAFHDWRETPVTERATAVRRLADTLRQQKSTLASLMTTEMGKLIGAAESEIEKCATTCEFFADHAPAWLTPTPIPTDASRSYVRYDPLGPVLAIMPWNFPFWQFFRFAAPALIAGNTAVLKHAPNVPACAAAIEQLFADAGFPPGVVTHLRVDNPTAESLIRHPAIAAVTLTGSERAGIAVATAAAAVLKKSVLELGGSDPFIILPDADLESTARAAVDARCINAGQSCIAAKRFIVVGGQDAADAFARRMAALMSALTVGDPTDRATHLGPLARLDLLDHLHSQVERSVAAGAQLLTGGHRLPRPGFFYAPTVLANVTPTMPAFEEETFGPVAPVIAADDLHHALTLANQSRYGLGASLWTTTPSAVEALIPHLESGNVFVNGAVRSDPRLPFGGTKRSGWGRELAREGLHEFTHIKTVLDEMNFRIRHSNFIIRISF